MDQILAFDASAGILEDLHRTISIIMVMREIRGQRATDTEEESNSSEMFHGEGATPEANISSRRAALVWDTS